VFEGGRAADLNKVIEVVMASPARTAVLPRPGQAVSPSSPEFAGLTHVDGFGQLPCPPGAAAEFAQDAPGFKAGVAAFTGAT
jgi:hypothetical protein